MIVVTPHLGDAVLGCTDLLAGHAGAVVVSVFAGIPSNAYVVPEWDAACGFSSPRQAVSARRREDRAALEVLDAEPCWLAFPDSQYRRTATLEEIAVRLARALRRHRPDAVAIPLGLLPGDHALAHAAALRLTRHMRCDWIAYDDAPPFQQGYGIEERLALLRAEPLPVDENPYLKRRAAECYESLARGFARAGRELRSWLAAPERYWRLSP
ncbi:MAG TPA: PIG-L family deacetylase [Burkholderiales bacterium]|nr:PIG-L family deacetylase [Burkholderiales bacterium]